MELDNPSAARPSFASGPNTSTQTLLIIGAEDEEFENDIALVDDKCSYFQCIDLLKERPTYLIIFLHHVILQFDASSVLCYLHGEMFKGLNLKDARRMFMDYFHTFLDRAAVLRVAVPHDISFELDRSRPDLLMEESLRNIVSGMQRAMSQEISSQLEDFRNKRMMGMTIGEKELAELDADRELDREALEMKEKSFAEVLLPRVEEATANTDDEKSNMIYNAVVTYMKYLGVKTREPRVLEKKRHFLIRRKVKTRSWDEAPNTRKEIEVAKVDEKKRKGFSILDLRRQTRTDPASGSDLRTDAVKAAIDRKNSSHTSRLQAEIQMGKGKPSVEVSEVASVSATGNLPSREDTEGEMVHTTGTPRSTSENQSFRDTTETAQRSTGELLSAGDGGTEDGGDIERRKSRLSAKLGRSASLRTPGDRRRSHKGAAKGKQPRSRSDVDVQAASCATDLQRHNPDPGGSGGADGQQCLLPAQCEESGLRAAEVETEPPSWRQLISPEQLVLLSKSEVKRQEVINELFMTEHAHVRMLRVLHEVFYLRMLNENILSSTELRSIFPSLDELIDVHDSFCGNIKKIRQENGYLVTEIGHVLLARFHGQEGEWFKKLTSRYCSHQSFALNLLKSKIRKDLRFSQFIQDAQSNPQCRRLQLKDIIPIEMQRLTKYPLLLENIAKYTEQTEEKQRVQQAAECCRNILKDVNQDVRDIENMRRLHDYQRRLDMTNLKQSTDPIIAELVKNLDLTQKRMMQEGPLVWKLTKEKAIDVHVLLLEDILVLMQKVDDRMVLKCHSKNSTDPSEGKQMLCPIVRLGGVLARDVATDHKAFFILFQTSTGAQIYELVASSVSERRSWCENIEKTQEALKLSRPLMTARNSLTVNQVNAPLSPTEPLSNPENGFLPHDRICSENGGKEGEGSSQDGGQSGPDVHPGTEVVALTQHLKALDVDPEQLAAASEERWVPQALDEVHRMKQQLAHGQRSSRDPPSTGSGEQEDGEAGDTGGSSEGGDIGLGAQESAGDVEDQEEGEDGGPVSLQAAGTPRGSTVSEGEADLVSSPIVLSLEQVEKIARTMNSLLVKLEHLKARAGESRTPACGLASPFQTERLSCRRQMGNCYSLPSASGCGWPRGVPYPLPSLRLEHHPAIWALAALVRRGMGGWVRGGMRKADVSRGGGP
ncbi:LOW QUALITY PROTEIN: rho guanine nucleotide exchange factor 1-like [Narcine bancroftii]|uniref:LOW QUALITY PROTEIN: rho guanine nucleotide exchange factor 1-like n=1 Tax=Narcine bancroftii TaxID=1343680 RepID=UPI00383132A0